MSVISDTTSATITTSQSDIMSVTQELSDIGLTVKQISLHGRFHSSVHNNAVQTISRLCDSDSNLQFPTASKLLTPLRSNSNAQIITQGSLHRIALESILTEQTKWYLTMSAATSQLSRVTSPTAVVIGLVDCIPPSIVRQLGLKITKSNLPTHFSRGPASALAADAEVLRQEKSIGPNPSHPDHAVAVVGMACKFPGADSIEEFWQLLTAGTSMLQELPNGRFSTQGLHRTPDSNLRFWGNFIRDLDAFDHRFFKKSSREAASMDPQQRLLLQVAYQAMESTGYFAGPAGADDIGCYVGVCASDYNDNVASHPPNAFSSLGTLRAFLSGKISHFFGWTGPSVTYDTACSSSAVAIHAACQAIRLGECSKALAGGVSVYTSPNFYQNLAAASFLSPTGASKPFDANADGYCRGEGVGLVVLKKLSDARAEGDNILGVIAGTAVNQNSNASSITVPSSPSQTQLYQKVSSLAGIDPMEVSFVEAHGTGTPVGDPLEFESIRTVFGGSRRPEPLHLASVKGNIGHLEGASGVAALIKTLLMMQYEIIPVQASFANLNPKIRSLESDQIQIQIPQSTWSWNTPYRMACINNYGAAGSNAAMIVCQSPLEDRETGCQKTQPFRYPIFLSANSTLSLVAYCRALRDCITQLSSRPVLQDLLPSLAFNLANKQNRSLPHILTATAANLTELNEQLAAGASESSVCQSQIPTKINPVVLVFGGQGDNTIGLSEDAFHSSSLLRSHLEHCDAVLQAQGLHGLFPGIFHTDPIEDIINLHCMLFSLQYSCARSWIDAGLQVDAVVGHSFGQLTALCVSGSLSLEDGIRLIAGRASLMQEYWGPERGSMIAVEADSETISNLISSINKTRSGSNHGVEIACYNGPTSHVLVGTHDSILAVEEIVHKSQSHFRSVKCKKLKVTHGFHSVFTEPLLPGLTNLADQLVFKEPTIALETCSVSQSWSRADPKLIAEHTRTPVYFGQAIERLGARFGSCTWLEAGSGSAVIGMVRRALDVSNDTSHLFQHIQLSNSNGTGSLADATINLWRAGHNVNFWQFHRCQRYEYSPINLPPYQFEKPRHWLEWLNSAAPAPSVDVPNIESEPNLLEFIKFHDQSKSRAEFFVDSRSTEYKLYVQGHAVLSNPLCPAPLYIELVSRAAIDLGTRIGASNYIPRVEDLEIKAPLGMDVDRAINISLKKVEGTTPAWTFVFESLARESGPQKTEAPRQHATGKITLRKDDAGLLADFSRYERLIGANRFDELKDDASSEAMQGSLVYKVFAKVVRYADYYKGVRSIFANHREVVGYIDLPRHDLKALNDTATNPLAMDNFVQVAGLHVNNLNECGENEVFVCTQVQCIQPSPNFEHDHSGQRSWIVYSNFTPTSEREVDNDIFVFDSDSKNLVLVILGAHFTKVLISSLTKVLSRANPLQLDTAITNTAYTAAAKSGGTSRTSPTVTVPTSVVHPETGGEHDSASRLASQQIFVDAELRKLITKVAEVPEEAIKDDSTLEGLGVDSLMVTEVLGDINKHFEIEIPLDDFQNLLNVKSLSDYLKSKGCGGGDGALDRNSSSSDSNGSMSASPGTTAATSVYDAPVSQNDTISQLAKIVAGHLETTVTMSRETNLADQGLDSLLCMELATDIQKSFGVVLDMSQLDNNSTFGDLSDMVSAKNAPVIPADTTKAQDQSEPFTLDDSVRDTPLRAHQAFEDIRYDYDDFTKETGFADFWRQVYPRQAQLVLAYVVEALAALGCSLSSLKSGEPMPPIQGLPQHAPLVAQFNEILKDASLVSFDGTGMVRSKTPLDNTSSSELYRQILVSFPQHASEHKLLHITGSKLAECVNGAADPLQLLFRKKENRELLEDVYTNGPMYEAITKLLGKFLCRAFSSPRRRFHILELGGGTGGTTKYIIDHLVREGVQFSYTFTDISGSLVTAARKKFSGYGSMDFMVLDIEKTPPERLLSHFHTIISTNCIHATRNLTQSTTNIRKMLRSDGFVSLVEFTRNIFWFDLVFGLLGGWWLFEDGRKHVLADMPFWENSMKSAGFKHVSCTDGVSEEARTLRIISGFVVEPDDATFKPAKSIPRKSETSMETVVYKQAGGTPLNADIYFPSTLERDSTKRPVGKGS